MNKRKYNVTIDVEELAKEYIGFDKDRDWTSDEDYYNPKAREFYSFIDGFKKALEIIESNKQFISNL